MSGELEKANFQIGANKETADWVNNQHQRMERGTRLLFDIALSIGGMLVGAQKCNTVTFAEWAESNLCFTIRTAYRYISLYNHKNQITDAKNIDEAYKMIESLEAQEKRSEEAKAYERVKEYNRTGRKPEGWRRGTDDKLAKEEADRDARVEAAKREALEWEERKAAEEQARRSEAAETRRESEARKAEADRLIDYLGRSAEAQMERAAFKEKIRLSSEGAADPFNDALLDYLGGLEDDNRRIEACYNIIKICKRVAAGLQAGNAAA